MSGEVVQFDHDSDDAFGKSLVAEVFRTRDLFQRTGDDGVSSGVDGRKESDWRKMKGICRKATVEIGKIWRRGVNTIY